MPKKILARCAKRRLNVQGERAETPTTQRGEDGKLQDFFIQMHCDVRTQLIWKVSQELGRVHRKERKRNKKQNKQKRINKKDNKNKKRMKRKV